MDEWIRSTGVRYFSELNEYGDPDRRRGELSLFNLVHFTADQFFREVDKDKKLSDELADVLWVILCIANQNGPYGSIQEKFP